MTFDPRTCLLKGDRVCVEIDDNLKRTVGGIHLPDTVEQLELVGSGVVVSIGDGESAGKSNIAVGNRVYFYKHEQFSPPFMWAGKRYNVLALPQVVAVQQ